MKKSINILFALLLGFVVVFGVAGCNTNKQNELKFDEELETSIKQDYMEQFGFEFKYDCFYGIYDNCVVFFVAGDAAVVKSITIADQNFQYSYDWEIYVWNNGQFKTLAEAYSANWLTAEDIEAIALRHAAEVEA